MLQHKLNMKSSGKAMCNFLDELPIHGCLISFSGHKYVQNWIRVVTTQLYEHNRIADWYF